MNYITSKLIIIAAVLFSFLTNAQTKTATNEGEILWTANWSHNGGYIAIGGDDKKIRIYDGKTFELLKTHNHQSEVKRLRWHPKKNILAIAAIGNGSKLIDLDTNKTIEFIGLNSNGSRAIAWNHNGKLIALADFEGILTVWNTNGELINTINKKTTYSYVGVDWHPKKNEIITLSENVRIYNVKGDLLNQFKHRKEEALMLCVKWHKSGKFFVMGDYGDPDIPLKPLLQFWKEDGTIIKQKDLSKSEYRNVSWNKKGKRLATASDDLRIWNKKGKLLYSGKSKDKLWGIDWSPNGKHIVTSSEKGKIIIWNKKAKLITSLQK